jgi:hypothetical protein
MSFSTGCGLIGIVFHRNPWSIADKVLTEELSSAIPALPIICTLAVSIQRCSNEKKNRSGEVSFLIVAIMRSTSSMVSLWTFHSHREILRIVAQLTPACGEYSSNKVRF